MDKELERLTGAVSVGVDADVTPTTREKIDKTVPPTEWSEMSTTQLWEQKSILLKRISYAYQSNHPEMAIQIQRGVDTIEAIITAKHNANPDKQLY